MQQKYTHNRYSSADHEVFPDRSENNEYDAQIRLGRPQLLLPLAAVASLITVAGIRQLPKS